MAEPHIQSAWLSRPKFVVLLALAAGFFHAAYASTLTSFLIVGFFGCTYAMTRAPSGRWAFYGGLLLGLLIYSPHLLFFWSIFREAAVLLWLVLAFWIAAFLILSRMARARFSERPVIAVLLIPIFWAACEYFRCEVYYLRFTWLTPGLAFSGSAASLGMRVLAPLGVYGMSLLMMALVAGVSLFPRFVQWGFIAVVGALLAFGLRGLELDSLGRRNAVLSIAGVQLEFPRQSEAIEQLNRLLQLYPEAQLYMLSEYTFTGPVPDSVLVWCREHRRYLLLGVKEPAKVSGEFRNTACVVGPEGTIVFRQVKSVPIQFFKDGLPASSQSVWNSPWGKLGVCICYDLGYRRVTDELIRQGAQAILAPTMDLESWGEYEHQLHGRIAPMRAAEYRIPIFRLCSSGISQAIDANGRVIESEPYPGRGRIVSAELKLPESGRLPLDRYFGPAAVAVTGLAIVSLAIMRVRSRRVALPQD